MTIDWQSRANTIWKTHFSLKRGIKELHNIAVMIDPRAIGVYEDFRRKFNGTRAASASYAKILFSAGEFDKAGITLVEWTSSDAEWIESASSLAPVDVLALLSKQAAKGSMQITASSTPDRIPQKWRRLRDGDRSENELKIRQYLQLTAAFPGSSDERPVHLLALEWSASLRDWQIFNFVKSSALDIDRPEPVVIRGGDAVARISVGLIIGGPPDTFDLFVLGQRTPFDHRARSFLDNLGRRSQLSQLEMSRLVQLLFGGAAVPDVATTTYAVVD